MNNPDELFREFAKKFYATSQRVKYELTSEFIHPSISKQSLGIFRLLRIKLHNVPLKFFLPLILAIDTVTSPTETCPPFPVLKHSSDYGTLELVK